MWWIGIAFALDGSEAHTALEEIVVLAAAAEETRDAQTLECLIPKRTSMKALVDVLDRFRLEAAQAAARHAPAELQYRLRMNAVSERRAQAVLEAARKCPTRPLGDRIVCGFKPQPDWRDTEDPVSFQDQEFEAPPF